jgi:hypothetical protein
MRQQATAERTGPHVVQADMQLPRATLTAASTCIQSRCRSRPGLGLVVQVRAGGYGAGGTGLSRNESATFCR